MKHYAVVCLMIFLGFNALSCGDGDTGESDGGDHDSGVQAVCTYGMDQTCNDDPMISSIHGTCNEDGTCTCDKGWDKNPETGRCL